MKNGYEVIYQDNRLQHYVIAVAELKSKTYSENTDFHNHHIVPRAMGGGDESNNLVRISIADHKDIHKLLANCLRGTEYQDHYRKMRYAAEMMENEYKSKKRKRMRKRGKQQKNKWRALYESSQNRIDELESRIVELMEYIDELESDDYLSK
jgi:hypothetical protein